MQIESGGPSRGVGQLQHLQSPTRIVDDPGIVSILHDRIIYNCVTEQSAAIAVAHARAAPLPVRGTNRARVLCCAKENLIAAASATSQFASPMCSDPPRMSEKGLGRYVCELALSPGRL